MMLKKILTLVVLCLCIFFNATACTIFSGIDKKGQVWAGNNEDNIFTFNIYLNLAASTDSTFGYAFFTNSKNQDEYIQGGVNDAGLFYDGNSVPPSVYKDFDTKKDFPGGHRAMLKYILGKCKTVQEVISLFKQYRLPGMESSQLHFADKYGTLGIIVADSMWVTKANYQVSTNYNLCHADKDQQTCWRFPIAERILKSKEPGIDSFREICDSTSQKAIASTVYSNIHNLNTGEIWLYYAMDYNNAYKTTIKELLKRGNASFPIYELFLETPLVTVYKTYQVKGIKKAIEKLNGDQLSSERKNLIIRLLYFDLIMYKYDFKNYSFFSDLIASNCPTDEFLQVFNTRTLFFTGKQSEAIKALNNYSTEHPEGQFIQFAKGLLKQMQGQFDTEANVKFELNGYKKAKYVFVEGIESPNIQYFLILREGKWIGNFKLEPEEYHYIFLADGKRILDKNNPNVVKENGLDYNKIVVKK